MKKLSVLFLLLFSLFLPALAQDTGAGDDSVIVVAGRDTTLIKSYAARYDPRKALLYAAVLPGLGQIYNKKYWKLPLVYGGFIGFGSGISFYQKGYIKYKDQLFYNLEHGLSGDNQTNPTSNYTTKQLRTFVNKYRRERDFMVILMGGMYLLQIIDAHVDSHLKEFDLNPNLRVSIEPMIERDALLGKQTGASLIIKF